MAFRLKHYVERATALPLSELRQKVVATLRRDINELRAYQQDKIKSSYSTRTPSLKLHRYFSMDKAFTSLLNLPQLLKLSQLYLKHNFSLLGSGWVQVRHGIECGGTVGHCYPQRQSIKPDTEGVWLKGRLNEANLHEAQRIWKLISPEYMPIDWHLDFTSGYRWAESTWYKHISFGKVPGVDVKVPWELSRMQHLPQLSWAFLAASEKSGHSQSAESSLYSPGVYLLEFENQILDFIATNPPRFGVNWACTMDAAIRVSNWLVAYDLLRAAGAKFDSTFDEILARSVFEHAVHIIENLEYSLDHPIGNHYLANILGLLFCAAYLPCCAVTDVWLAFAIQQLVEQVESQFNTDGSNFEASTSYHRLSAEMACYGTALTWALPDEKQSALREYNHRMHVRAPSLHPAPIQLFNLVGNNGFNPFPESYLQRLLKMAHFMADATRPDMRVPQIGDNDNGRFLKLQPQFFAGDAGKQDVGPASIREAEGHTLNEDHLDHRSTVAAINGLCSRDEFTALTVECRLETALIHRLLGKTRETQSTSKIPSPTHTTLDTYPDFGLYIYRTSRFYLAVRCGIINKKTGGGHAHDDQLSFEFAVGDVPVIVDPGTYLYTPSPEWRNRFRSTVMHNNLFVPGREEGDWRSADLFGLPGNSASARTLRVDQQMFVGQHLGFGLPYRRSLQVLDDLIEAEDFLNTEGEKSLNFHLAPEIRAEIQDQEVLLSQNGKVVAVLSSPSSTLFLADSLYSPGYGEVQATKLLRLMSTEKKINWRLRVAL